MDNSTNMNTLYMYGMYSMASDIKCSVTLEQGGVWGMGLEREREEGGAAITLVQSSEFSRMTSRTQETVPEPAGFRGNKEGPGGL